MTLEKAIEWYLELQKNILAPKTLRIYRQYLDTLTPKFAGCPVELITLDDLRAWRDGEFERMTRQPEHTHVKARKLSAYTVHGETRTVRTFFRRLHIENKISENPAARLELPQLGTPEPKSISEADAQRMLEIAQCQPRDYAMLLFFASTGCRLGGLMRLRLEDLDFEHQRATVREKGRGGRFKIRTVFMTVECIEAMQTWLNERRLYHPKHDHVFTTVDNPRSVPTGRRISEKGIGAILERIARRAGVQGPVNPHAWRHAFARRLTMNGAPLGVVSQIMGHSRIEVTNAYYARFAVGELQSAFNKYTGTLVQPAVSALPNQATGQ